MINNLYNHIAPTVSNLEKQMIKHIPAGGNWKHIPISIPSKRLEQIRHSGGRTTYYGRLRYENPSYTISTYFNRIGNGCHIHPEQNRLISIREGARLQSFPDSFVFYGSKTSQYKQIGNAVPPLLARVVANFIFPHLKNKTFIDLFAGAGGMSKGFLMEKYKLLGAIEFEKNFFNTYLNNHPIDNPEHFILGDITKKENKDKIFNICKKSKVGVVIGGPPCQGFSLAGWRNPDDERNKLFKEFVEIVDKVKPEFFVMENVAGLLSMEKGKIIQQIIKEFEGIGYTVQAPQKLCAEEFGVPQKRRRVFIIGSRKKIELGIIKPLFSEKDSNLPKPVSVYEAIFGLPPLESGEESSNLSIIANTKYQEFLMEKISFQEFYKSIR